MTLNVVLVAVAVRVFIALATQTFFQPDEYYQSLEVAHHFVFGYGHLTWEWLTPKPIRSIVYPLLNVPIYIVLKKLGLDDTRLLILGPKLLHGLLGSLTDIFICRLTTRVAGERYAKVAFLLSLTSFYNGLSLSRSLSNSLETSLTTMALSLYPWDTRLPSWRKDYRKALIIAAVACAVRPTNVIIWLYMISTSFWLSRRDSRTLITLAIETVLIGNTAIVTLCAVDSWYYGTLAFTPLNFVTTNLSSVSLFYGSSSWKYYLQQGIPILCGTSLPFVIQVSLKTVLHNGPPKIKRMIGLIIWTTGAYSLVGHKEWRFIHPLLPVLHILGAIAMVDYHDFYGRALGGQRGRTSHLPFISKMRASHFLVFAANILPLLYLIFAHSRAQISVMHYLRSLDPIETHSIGFIMPCHSTPWQAYLHRPSLAADGRLWALGCEPPLGINATGYKDQTDVFYESPSDYLRDRFPPMVDPNFPPSPLPITRPGQTLTGTTEWRHEWPQYLVCFSVLLDDAEVAQLLYKQGYRTAWRENHGWEGDSRRRGGVVVLKF